MQVAQMLLSVGAPLVDAKARWLVDGERRGHLHLPRFDDNVFGVTFSFPLPPPLPAEALNAQKPIETAPPSRISWHDTSSLYDEERERDLLQAEAAEATASATLDMSLYSRGKGTAEASESTALDVTTSNEEDTSAHAASSAPADEVVGESDLLSLEPVIADGTSTVTAAQVDEKANQLLSVKAILATHTRDEIVLELQWARQALRDRRKVS